MYFLETFKTVEPNIDCPASLKRVAVLLKLLNALSPLLESLQGKNTFRINAFWGYGHADLQLTTEVAGYIANICFNLLTYVLR